jgi:Phosphotransferase system, mannose/fructose/N-acetylgalactosamine-specific component IIB
MAEIGLTRVDFRLIHGQIIVKWRKVCQITKIVIIDDVLVADDFLTKIYVAAAPQDIQVRVYSEDRAMQLWEKNRFGTSIVLILFKDIATCYRMIKRGMALKEVQLGGAPHAPDKKVILKAVSLNADEISMISEMHDEYHVDVSIQVVPENTKLEFADIIKNFQK